MACVFFVLDLPEEDPSPTAAFVKALPVLSLAWLVCLHGVRYGNAPSNYVAYNRRILYGLLFAIAGDILLVWQQREIYFMLGMVCFTGTQICYILAFGFTPFGLKEFIPSLVGLIVFLSIINPCVPAGLMGYLVPVYATLLSIMGWRSLACFTLSGDIPWKKILSAIGAFLFVISDIFIGINKFCYPVPFERVIVMTTYYAAQLFISLSVINFHLTSSGGYSMSPSSSRQRSPRPSDAGDRPSSPSDRPPSPVPSEKSSLKKKIVDSPSGPLQKKLSATLVTPSKEKPAEGTKLSANKSEILSPRKSSGSGSTGTDLRHRGK